MRTVSKKEQIKNIWNYNINLEQISISFNLVWFFYLSYALITENIKNEINQLNYLSFLFLCISFMIINILNLNFKNHFITLLNICILIFYLPTIFLISIDKELFSEYLKIYPNLFTFLNQLTLQYFILSLCIIVIFFKINFQKVIINKNISTLNVNFRNYTYTFFFISLFLVFQNLLINYFLPYIPIKSFLEGSTYMILTKVFDLDIFVFLYIASLFFQPINKKIIFLTLVLFSIYIFNSLYFLGNRSTPLQIILNFIFLMVLTNSIYKLKIKFIFFSFFFSPILPIYFSIAGALRKYLHVEKIAFGCGGNVHCYKDNDLRYFIEYYMAWFDKDGQKILYLENFKQMIVGLVDRISYFDFYIFNMSNADLIAKNIPLIHYFKSVVDKFSPGFDFYGVPLVKNLLYDVFNSGGIYSNSLQFTFFAENQIMFNYFYVILIIIFLLIFRFSIQFVHKFSIFSLRVFSLIFIYQLYWLYITGFGYDYFLVKSAYTLIFLIIFSAIIYKYEKN